MNWWFPKFIVFIIASYFVIFSVISVNRYWQYQTFYLDFGIYDEAIWKVSRFETPIVDKGENGKINLADHFTPGMYLLAPIYWVTDRQEAMFIAQTLAVSIAAWVAYTIARSRTENKFVQTALVVSFLGFVGMQNALITDIHEITFAVLPLTLTFWAIEKQKWKHFFIFLIVLLSFKENMAGVAIGIGLYLLIRYKKKHLKEAISTILIGFAWGFLTTTVIIPSLNSGIYSYAPTFLEGQSIVTIISRFFSEGIKRQTILYTYTTFGFLPLLDISTWPLVLEHYLERFVLSTAGTRIDLGFHYNSILVPVLFMGSLNTFVFLQKKVGSKAVSLYSLIIIGWVLFYSRFIYHGPIDLFYNKAFYEQRKNVTYQDDFVKIFPKKGLVLTQNDLAVRLTHGSDIRLLRADFEYLHPDYVILNLTPGQNANSYYPASLDIAKNIRDYYQASEDYTLTKGHDEQYLFIKKGM